DRPLGGAGRGLELVLRGRDDVPPQPWLRRRRNSSLVAKALAGDAVVVAIEMVGIPFRSAVALVEVLRLAPRAEVRAVLVRGHCSGGWDGECRHGDGGSDQSGSQGGSPSLSGVGETRNIPKQH